MATRTQGMFLGCLFLLTLAVLFVVMTSLLLSPPWVGDGLSLGDGDQVGLVILQGPINTSREIVSEIESHRKDGSIKAVVLRINSPGGEVAPSQEIHAAVLRLAESKPVVASLGGVAASGAFYAAVGADSIVADPGSVVGSIGVIFMYPTARELMDKVGVDWHVYKSGRLKDMGSFSREPTEEEEAIFDSIISDVYDQFVTAVTEGRELDRSRVVALADGRIFSGRQAKELGLVDRLGDLHAAADLAAGMAGLPAGPRLVRKSRPRLPFLDLLDRLLRDQARSSWGPRLEYRLR